MPLDGKLINNVLGGVDSIANFSVAARTFVPALNVCPKATAFDQYGRPSGFGGLNTLTAPGCYSPEETILNENSLRPPLSSNPLYKNIQAGIGGYGVDTMYGLGLPGRGYAYAQQFNFDVNNSAACMIDPSLIPYYQFTPEQRANLMQSCNPNASVDLLGSVIGGSRNSDVIKNVPMFK